MKAHLPHNITEEKLARFFAGEASSEESQEVKHWAGQSAENRDLLLQLQIVWIDTGSVRLDDHVPSGKYDVDAAWKQVKNRKHAAGEEKSSTSWGWRVAAGVVLLVGMGLLLRSYFSQPEQLTYTAQSDVDTVALADGSSVILNERSSLIYPEDFRNNQRIVKLEGEAFFEVDHNPEQPFIVQAGPTLIRVLGTSFNVRMKASEVTVIVETGKVLFSRGSEEIVLTAGQKGIFSVKTKQLTRQDQTMSGGADQFWRTKTLTFTSHKLPDVAAALEQAYGVNIRLKGANLSNCSLSVTFRDDSLDNILDVIALTLNLKVTKAEDEIVLSGEGCIKE